MDCDIFEYLNIFHSSFNTISCERSFFRQPYILKCVPQAVVNQNFGRRTKSRAHILNMAEHDG